MQARAAFARISAGAGFASWILKQNKPRNRQSASLAFDLVICPKNAH